jgi:hypothetical protein
MRLVFAVVYDKNRRSPSASLTPEMSIVAFGAGEAFQLRVCYPLVVAGRTFVATMERPGSDVGDRNAARPKETGFAFHALKGFPPRPESGRHNLTGCSVLLIT